MYLKLVSSCLFSLPHCRCPKAKDHIWLVPGWVSVPVMSQVPEAAAERHRDRETQGDMERDRERWDRATERHTHAKSGREGEEQENWTHFCFFLFTLLSLFLVLFCARGLCNSYWPQSLLPPPSEFWNYRNVFLLSHHKKWTAVQCNSFLKI